MVIVDYPDSLINFLGDAFEEIRYDPNKVIIPTENGMHLLIGKYKSWYDILLRDGNKLVAGVQLVDKGHSVDGKRAYEPHSYTRKKYRGCGYVEQIYCWLLDEGIVLRSCGRQTKASHQLWMKLSWIYNIRAYNKRSKQYVDMSKLDKKPVVLELSR